MSRPTRLQLLKEPLLILAGAVVFGAYAFAWTPLTGLPGCPLHTLTGLYCPGCGTTRALVCLAHGDFAGALSNNALAAVLGPVSAVVFLRFSALRAAGRNVPLWGAPAWVAWGVGVVALLWAAFRYTPWGGWLLPD
ncbi:MAG: DUF2752 domain-containing protein [Acidobacteriota bacterium]|jgi:hypothetical protein|nr:DUF2752 domain-containing protein [Acidobacteriota bacterium]